MRGAYGKTPFVPPKPQPIDFDRTVTLPPFWSSLAYLLLSFPLGTFYFVFLVTGISVGFGTLVIWIGLFVLYGVLAVSRALARFEQSIARGMLGVRFSSPAPRNQHLSLMQSAKMLITSSAAWRSIAYLFVKFPLGVLSFVVTVTMVSTSLSLLLTPVFYRMKWAQLQIGRWHLNTVGEATLAAIAGLVLCFLTYHVLRGVAWVHAWWARTMLAD